MPLWKRPRPVCEWVMTICRFRTSRIRNNFDSNCHNMHYYYSQYALLLWTFKPSHVVWIYATTPSCAGSKNGSFVSLAMEASRRPRQAKMNMTVPKANTTNPPRRANQWVPPITVPYTVLPALNEVNVPCSEAFSTWENDIGTIVVFVLNFMHWLTYVIYNETKKDMSDTVRAFQSAYFSTLPTFV